MERILIVDDDVPICTLLSRFLIGNGYQVRTAYAGKEGLHCFTEERFDLVLTDHRLPDMDSFELLDGVQRLNGEIPVMIMTAYSDVGMAVRAIRQGAYHFATKPLYPDELLAHVREALILRSERHRAAETLQHVPLEGAKSVLVKGSSLAIQHVMRHVELVAPTDLSVILAGETGTGKEYTARAIHALSRRSKGPFVAIDCGCLENELAQSELFGHTKGAFTGAETDRMGSFEAADGGTLFLDEVGNLSLDNQVKLLRALQERTIRRVGSEKDLPVNVRIIAATNEDLERAVAEGKFREDLFHRLNEFAITLPALRERKEDIPLFARHFLAIACAELERSVLLRDEVMETLIAYSWPGNLRELRNVIKRAVLFCTGTRVGRMHLPSEVWDFGSLATFKTPLAEGLREATEIAEREAILAALERTDFSKGKAAKFLGIDRKTLYYKMKAYGLST